MHVLDCCPLKFAKTYPAVALVTFSILKTAFRPYFAGETLLAIGLQRVIENEMPPSHHLGSFQSHRQRSALLGRYFGLRRRVIASSGRYAKRRSSSYIRRPYILSEAICAY
jgi:hypothetical protein